MPADFGIIETKLSNPAEEAYNVLKANLQFYEVERKIKTLAVTSYSPGEGKTTTSINLAVSMAKSGMKILFVDADLRKPMMMKNLKSDDFKGLSNYLSGRAALEEIIHDTSVDGFFFATCGIKPINPVRLLNSERFIEFLNRVRDEFDMVIIDTPPLGSVIDCASIAAHTDGTLIVFQPGAVSSRNALMLREQLEKANAKILGAVLNKVSKIDYRDYYRDYDYFGKKGKYARDWLLKRGYGHD